MEVEGDLNVFNNFTFLLLKLLSIYILYWLNYLFTVNTNNIMKNILYSVDLGFLSD